MVAKYNQVEPEKPKKIITYIDPLSGEPILLMVEDDGSEVTPPTPNKYADMQFIGWAKIVDPNENTVYVAKYAPDCRNENPKPPTPADDPEPSTPDNPSGGKAPNTGDPYSPYEWMLLAMGSGALMVALRRKTKKVS